MASYNLRKYWWLIGLVLVILGWWGVKNQQRNLGGIGLGGDSYGPTGGVMPMVERGIETKEAALSVAPSMYYDPGISTAEDRVLIQENSISLLVENVDESAMRIQQLAEERGGFLVSRNVERPEESASGVVTVRVPADRRDEMIDELGKLAVRVISESVWGDDVTAQFEDLEARLEVLNTTKARLEGLLNQADNVSEILEVQRELSNLQYQIDAVQGQKEYLERAANLTKITAYLSTDELALPYVPDEAWRPRVIFKQAVRELVMTIRQIGSGVIWILVFTPIWISILILLGLVNKWYGKKTN